jgi:hypothetical protein
LAQNAKHELISLFESCSNSDAPIIEESEPFIKEELLEEDEEEEIETYIEADEDVKIQGHELTEGETFETEHAEFVDLIEVGYLDTDKLPKKFQSPEEKQKIMKAKSIKVKNDDDGLTIVQLDNNLKLFQCTICQRTFKEKSKLKSHLQIHTTERNIVCPVS